MSANLQFAYDPVEDRIVVTAISASGERRFAVSRRQCLALIMACAGAKGEAPPLKIASPAKPGASTSKSSGLGAPAPEAAGSDARDAAVMDRPHLRLARLYLKRSAGGLRITLTDGSETPFRVMLKPSDELSLAQTLRVLADRAKWDLDVAEERSVAQRRLRKAQTSIH